jgi:hypothetical protein
LIILAKLLKWEYFWQKYFGGNILVGIFWREYFGGNILAGIFWPEHFSLA